MSTITLPKLLARVRNWLTWSLKKNAHGKLTKAPDCSTTDRSRWRGLDDVLHTTPSHDCGPGFIFTGGVDVEGARLFAIDIDGCRDPRSGGVEPWAQKVLGFFPAAWVEVSPSGCGLHVWVLVQGGDELPKPQRMKAQPEGAGLAPNVPESKHAELQLFGYGVAQYMTVTGERYATDQQGRAVGRPEIGRMSIEDWRRFSDHYGFGMPGPSDGAAAALPRGTGSAPTPEAIAASLRRQPSGDDAINANWKPLLAKSEGAGKSASEAFWTVVQMVLRAANGHGKAAVDFLLHRTAWGRGEVDDSADPSKYERRSWVEKEVARCAAKNPTLTLGAEDMFEVVAADAPAQPDRAPESPLHKLWPQAAPTWFAQQPPPRRYLLRHPDGDGLLPQGKAATLSAAGGTGKTNAVCQLAVSVATGRPWLGHFAVDAVAPRRVLLLLGEEDAGEVHRRLSAAGAALGLTPAEREAVCANVVALPLAACVTPLLRLGPDGQPRPTEHMQALHARLQEAAGDGWGLIVLDPQSRFAGCDVEKDNALATAFVQHVEQLTTAPSNPTVLVVAHSSKLARRMGTADSRGVTGLTDGFRWHATLTAVGLDRARFAVEKNNYGRPSDPMHLTRGTGGLLFAETEAQRALREGAGDREREAQEAADGKRQDERVEKAVDLARRQPGLSKGELAAAIGGKTTEALRAVDAAVAKGLLVKRIDGKAHRYEVAGPST